MAERARVQGGAGVSPFRVSVQGATPAGARFDELVFDANAASLRVYKTGSLSVTHGGAWISYGSNPVSVQYSANPGPVPFGKTFPYPPIVLLTSRTASQRFIKTSDGVIANRPWPSVILPYTIGESGGLFTGVCVYVSTTQLQTLGDDWDSSGLCYCVFDMPVRD